jgi:hypothetical protein
MGVRLFSESVSAFAGIRIIFHGNPEHMIQVFKADAPEILA